MRLWFAGIATICRIEIGCRREHFLKIPHPGRVSPFSQLHRSASKIVVRLAQEFDVLQIRRDCGWQRRLGVGLGEAVEAEQLRVKLAPEIGLRHPARRASENSPVIHRWAR